MLDQQVPTPKRRVTFAACLVVCLIALPAIASEVGDAAITDDPEPIGGFEPAPVTSTGDGPDPIDPIYRGVIGGAPDPFSFALIGLAAIDDGADSVGPAVIVVAIDDDPDIVQYVIMTLE